MKVSCSLLILFLFTLQIHAIKESDFTCEEIENWLGLPGIAVRWMHGFSSASGSINYEKGTSFLDTIHVLQEDRGQGIGTELFKKYCKEVYRRGVTTLDWEVVPPAGTKEQIDKTVEFYKKFGAIIVGYRGINPKMSVQLPLKEIENSSEE